MSGRDVIALIVFCVALCFFGLLYYAYENEPFVNVLYEIEFTDGTSIRYNYKTRSYTKPGQYDYTYIREIPQDWSKNGVMINGKMHSPASIRSVKFISISARNE